MTTSTGEDTPLPEITFKDLTFHECIGCGTFGSVYRAHWISKNREVAVKKVLTLGKEAQVLSCLSHRNIIHFYGAVIIAPNYCLVTEYAVYGSLYAHLADPANQLDVKQILTWAQHIALGINYLHNEAAVKVIHRDLKSRNCVICDEMTVKLVDFGASRFHGSTAAMTMAGTFPWMAPEVILGNPISEKCDTFSYGVVLWELVTREVPFKGVEGIQVAWAVVEKNERLAIPSTCPDKLASLIEPCWEVEPKNRPSFKEILKTLDSYIDDKALSEETNTFLKNKEQWRAEIDEMMSRVQSMERQLQEKENKLDSRENHLRHLEEALAKQLVTPFAADAKHDANYWSEQEVYLWVLQLQTKGQKRNDLAQYAPLMLEHNITGRRLLLLSMDDLFALGIKSFGHRKDLQMEIQKLTLENYRLQHFPPLSSLKSISPTSSSKVAAESQPRTFHLILIFGNHSRQGPTPEEYKWKMYIETDCDDDSACCIKTVTFSLMNEPGTRETLQHPPYVMSGWRPAKKGIEISVECKIIYWDSIKKPKCTHHIHHVRPEARYHHTEKKIKMTGLRPVRVSSAAQDCLSDSAVEGSEGTLQGAWSTRKLQNSVDPALYETADKKEGIWCSVVTGKVTSSPSPTPSPAQLKKSHFSFAPPVDPSTPAPQWPVQKHGCSGTAPIQPPAASRLFGLEASIKARGTILPGSSEDGTSSLEYLSASSSLSTPSPEVRFLRDKKQNYTASKSASPSKNSKEWIYPRSRAVSTGSPVLGSQQEVQSQRKANPSRQRQKPAERWNSGHGQLN